ncbi:hypothetical protein C8J57DRAFT_1113502 [Mycena rebaudengoi]|nr:hypothetical protein C8J57DRAFT_1113502 [Mycena rebaudengoi]
MFLRCYTWLTIIMGAVSSSLAATCTTATVGSPFSTCFDIYTAAKLTAAQFAADNPGLDCSLLQIGQKVCISSGTLPSNAPGPSPNGTCAEYFVVSGDSCSAIATKFSITVALIEQWNVNTFKWSGCAGLQIGFTMCISSGTPPPIPVNPLLQCGPESPGNATCPLRACCSAFGFCGLTDDFCHTSSPNPCISNCITPTLPSCSTTRTLRNIGYYAGWADRRPCGVAGPEQTDWSTYTHAHFAFAVVSQSSEIQLASADDPLLRALVSQKTAHPGLKVLIGVGGWAFSEDIPTRDVFSVMISTAATRAKFIASARSFLAQYNLDGIDIDFEYPGAIERDAPATDTPNLTTFFKELRAGLPSAIIVCTAPAGYWFLKGFEIDKIVTSVDYINMMSYDYHGQWDVAVTGQAPVSNPHTSLLDIRDSALLYIRAGIDLSKVNLGLAFYGRTYHLANPACKGYNCTMVAGGAAAPCTGTSGYIAQFEITNLLSAGIKPTLDISSETYWFDNGGDLVSFDQSDTWAVKQKFAGSTCFGGTFVWSVDQVLSGSDSGSGSGSGSGGLPGFDVVDWNPNPHPSPGALSETFVGAGSTVIVPIPTQTTFITVGGAIIEVNSGGTPVNAMPLTVSLVNAVTPTWSFNIVPPASPSITFTAPISGIPTFTTVVASPTSGAVAKVTGPGGVVWTLTAGPAIIGSFPSTIGIFDGATPSAIPPVGWLGPWTDPVPPHTVTTGQPAQVNSQVPWNPNPHPSPGAASETFVCSGTTTSLAIPQATTTISVGAATIVLNSGGTPVNGPLASQCTEVGGIIPLWSQDIIPPPGAATITFTGPLTSTPTWVTIVPVPSKEAPAVTVTGPPGDRNRCNSFNFWTLLFGGAIFDCLPLDIGIIGGITPVPIPPSQWKGPWTNPIPRPTPPPDGDGSTKTTTSASSRSTSSSETACQPKPTVYDWPDDPENVDFEGDGTDPDRRRRQVEVAHGMDITTSNQPRGGLDVLLRATVENSDVTLNAKLAGRNVTDHSLLRRANRHIQIKRCPSVEVESPRPVNLQQGRYYRLDPSLPWISTALIWQNVVGRPTPAIVPWETNQEHVFELGYISQFVGSAPMTNGDCTWVNNNLFNYVRTNGGTMGDALIAVIDNVNNMVWVDKQLNQAKSNVVNDNCDAADHPPYYSLFDYLFENGEFIADSNHIYTAEFFLRNLAALGQYFSGTAGVFRATALDVQNLLSEITPSTPLVDDASLPLLFNSWLRNTLSQYSNGCIDRGNNALAYYRVAMEEIVLREGPVLPCYQIYYTNTYNPSGFNYQALMPAAPQSPQCNVPGTVGKLQWVSTSAVGILDYAGNGGVMRMMGSGNTDFYALGSGPSLSGSHLYGTQTSCPGLYGFNEFVTPIGLGSSVNVEFSCNGLGTQTVDIQMRVDGQTLSNCFIAQIAAPHTTTWTSFCGASASVVTNCANTVFAQFPKMAITTHRFVV